MKLFKISKTTIITFFSILIILSGIGLYFGNKANANEPVFLEAPTTTLTRIIPNSNQIISFNDILKEPMNSVVNISVKTKVANNQLQMMLNDPLFRHFFGQRYGSIPKEKIERGLGSGVVLTKDGLIVTNNHVVDGADEIKVTLPNSKKEYVAKIIGVDKGTDLAVIKIEAQNLNPIRMANIQDVKVGDIVFAIGNPFGVGETVTQGIISALNKHGLGINQYENFIQTDASINPGNSGGALVDSRGYLIGINSAIFSKGGGNDGIGFTIPVDMVKNTVTQIAKNGKVSRGYMGINLSELDEKSSQFYTSSQGAIVADVEINSPASKAGLQRGDLITAINGISIDSPSTLQRIIGDKKPNEKINISIERGKKNQIIYLTLSDRAKAIAQSIIEIKGLKLNSITPELQEKLGLMSKKGAIITDINPTSDAANAGFQKGDIIVQIENTPIMSPNDAKKMLNSNVKKRVYVNRQGVIGIIVL
ncbi:MAG: Do family serine endopeptidase [Sulfurovaceae bacterium]|nr:Do family serine endopeptidase [Sulfurovaceae bacterium]MDD5548594.1 Do family serine endopeptidase [Sulfurovaceae bacterium]